jgi:hypothetical protein
MAADGVGILENDLALDVHDEFFARFDAKEEPDAIVAVLGEMELFSDGEREIHAAALAECLWSIGHPVEELRARLKQMIDGESGAAYWGELYPARKTALLRLLKKLARPTTKPAARKTRRSPKRRLFEEGDYLVFTKKNGRPIVAIVWIVEPRPPLRYDFVFPNLFRSPDTAKLLDTSAEITDLELGVFLGRGLRPKVTTIEHSVVKTHMPRFRRFGNRPFRFPTWQVGTCGYCVTFADFEKAADESGSRPLNAEELKAIEKS